LNRLQTSLHRANQPVFNAGQALAATQAAESKVLVG
jgi:hypothetical protein